MTTAMTNDFGKMYSKFDLCGFIQIFRDVLVDVFLIKINSNKLKRGLNVNK
jgi:hypothetical protein